MASATELFDSGDGDTISDRDEATVTRRFHVVVDAPSSGVRESPADYVLRSTTLLGSSAVPVGSPHPSGQKYDRAGLYAATYTTRRVSYLNHIVEVGYRPPLIFNFDKKVPWNFSFSPGFGTKRANSIYATIDPITGQPLSTPRWVDIGPKVYPGPYDAQGEYQFHTTTSNGTKWWGNPAGNRRIQGADVTYPIGTMTLNRQLSFYPSFIHSFVLALRNRTNTDKFLERPKGYLKFVGPQISSAQSPESRGTIWDITLLFEDSDEGWDIEIQDTWTEASTGEEVPVLRTGGGVVNEGQFTKYKYYNDIPFGALLGTLEAYA